MGHFTVEKVEFGGWKGCYALSNGRIQAIVTSDIGPRIMSLSYIDGENILKTYPDLLGKTEDKSWLNYGGHRLWHAPEDVVRTYYPDNTAVSIENHETFVRFTAPTEPTTGIQKELDISLHADKPELTIVHRLHNRNLWDITSAPWALSVMREGGQGFVMHPPRQAHSDCLVPLSSLILWAYTDLSDPRWTFSARSTRLSQQPGNDTPQKIGINTSEGWSGYHWQDLLFLKQIAVDPNALYTDMGSRMELFTNDSMLEVETLGPIGAIPAGGAVELTERWVLLNKQPAKLDDAALLAAIESVS